MLPQRASRLGAAAVGVALIVAACSSAASEDAPVVEVFGAYRGEEAVKFAATVESFEEQTGIDVRYVGAGSFAADIQARVTDANYPDVGIFPQPALVADFASRGLLAALPESVAGASKDDARDIGIEEIDPSGVAVWFRAAAKSLVWYRPDVFAEKGYAVPSTWDSLMALSQTMADDGVAPWCLAIESFGSTGWVGTDWIEDIVLREQGVELYDDWVAGDVLFDSAQVRNAFSTFGSIVHDPGLVLGGTNRILNESWQRAADPMFEDPAACMMQRQGSFWEQEIPEDLEFGRDIDFFLLPGLTDEPAPLLVSGEMVAAFNDRPEVAEFMRFIASPLAGEGWAQRGGFVSPHLQFGTDHYGSEIDRRVGAVIAEAADIRFDGSDLMPPTVGTGAFWNSMRVFIRTGDLDLAVTAVDDAWPSNDS